MGIVRMGIPQDIALYLKELSQIRLFVETGTYDGWTSYWASSIFDKVKTIELSKEIYDKTVIRHKLLSNVDFIYGDSRNEIKKIVNESKESILFWLDAHWCGSESYGENDQCPLIEELNIILQSSLDHIILVDDARLFLAPPALPNVAKQYPTLSEIVDVVSVKASYMIVHEDVIIIVPQIYRDDFEFFMQNKVTEIDRIMSIKNERLEKIKRLKRFVKRIILFKYWNR